MSSKAFRRLAADHNSLRSEGPPPNYLFPPDLDSLPDDITKLDIFLAGPHGTPYADGLWRLHLDMPSDYPAAPPKAFFRTKIWHPNVEEVTGSVCVDTLKRDWQSKLTLRDVLVTISCLLIYPNPASALNAEAGALLQGDFNTFSKRAKLMTSIHAAVPKNLEMAVLEAKSRGEEKQTTQPRSGPSWGASRLPTPPLSSAGSGLGIQGCSFPEPTPVEGDESKENGRALSPAPGTLRSYTISPRRQGLAIPLGELDISHELDMRVCDPEADDADVEMTFSSEQNIKNNKSTDDNITKSDFTIAEDSVSRTPQPLFSRTRPLLSHSRTQVSTSNHTTSSRPTSKSPLRSTGLTPHLSAWGGVSKPRAMSPSKPLFKGMNTKHTSKTRMNRLLIDEEASQRKAFEDRLWKLAGGDIRKYNRGDFGPKKTTFDRI